MDTTPFKRYRKGQMPTAAEYNRLVGLVSGMARSQHVQGFSDSTGFHTRRMPGMTGELNIKIFEVQSEAAGDGVYNCYEQTLDATEWTDTAGDPKFDDKDAVSVEVLNLNEAYPESTYYAALTAGDLLSSWQMMDDEDTLRWVGIPFLQQPIKERIFEVQSAASGDGIYNCYEQILDATEWGDTAGDAKFDDKNTDSVEVLNLNEAYPESTYYAALSAGDLLKARQVKDDEGNLRWVGIPFIKRPSNETFNVPRSAKITAVGTTTLTAKLLDSTGAVIGSGLTVEFREHLGTKPLSGDVWPKLAVNDYIWMVKERDNKWYFVGTFDDTTDCDA